MCVVRSSFGTPIAGGFFYVGGAARAHIIIAHCIQAHRQIGVGFREGSEIVSVTVPGNLSREPTNLAIHWFVVLATVVRLEGFSFVNGISLLTTGFS